MPKKTINSGAEVERLELIMERLRSEQGCPWDKRQTHQTLRPYLLEEAYEVLEAIDEGSPEHLQEELGDLLLQVVFHAQLGKEVGSFSLGDVIYGINEKMIRRHPHVFNGALVRDVAGVLENWERIKAEEKGGSKERAGEKEAFLLDKVPRNLPALAQAEKIQKKAAEVGFDWPDLQGPLAKINEEIEELKEAWSAWEKHGGGEKGEKIGLKTKVEEEFGDLLFSLVNLGRFLGVNPELALLRTVGKFRRRFRLIQEAAAGKGRRLQEMTLAEMDELWEESKADHPQVRADADAVADKGAGGGEEED